MSQTSSLSGYVWGQTSSLSGYTCHHSVTTFGGIVAGQSIAPLRSLSLLESSPRTCPVCGGLVRSGVVVHPSCARPTSWNATQGQARGCAP
jgi:hypothetical protein